MRNSRTIGSLLRASNILRLFFIMCGLIVIFGIIIHFLEPNIFPTIFDGIWWVVITASTVGYGDYVPTSTAGRIIGILLILSGGAFVTFYITALSASTINFLNAYNEGAATFRGEKHVVFVGWNQRVKSTIEQILNLERNTHVVLIDQTLQQNPYSLPKVHFVKGDPTDDATLQQANIQRAETILITADQNKNEKDADMSSILTLITAKGLNPQIHSIIEILTAQQVANAKRAGADELIETNTFSSFVMMNSFLSHGMSDTIFTMLNHIKGSKLKFVAAPEDCIGAIFGECSQAFLKEQKLLLGVKRNDESIVNPPLDFQIAKGDYLLVIEN
ncbi:potassium channel family protein [Bacillus tianshenii]|nr:potassium channel family protein [Bacillus tianshenii]